MRAKGLTYNDIASRCSTNRKTILQRVIGHRRCRLNDVENICRSLGFPVHEAFDPQEQQKPVALTPQPFQGCLPRILGILSDRGWSKSDLVKRLSYRQSTIARNLSGARDFNIPQLKAVADALGIELDTLASTSYPDSLVCTDALAPPDFHAEDRFIAFTDTVIKSGQIMQKTIASRMGLKTHTLMAWRKKRARISAPNFLRLCDAIGIDPSVVLQFERAQKTPTTSSQ